MKKVFSVFVILLMILVTVQVSFAAQCGDGVDNDDDGLIDFPSDPDCINEEDPTEGLNDDLEIPQEEVEDTTPVVVEEPEEVKAACNDGVDNDVDGFIDFPSDPGCESETDNNEFHEAPDTSSESSVTGSEPVEEDKGFSTKSSKKSFPWGILIAAAPVVLAVVGGAKASGDNKKSSKEEEGAALEEKVEEIVKRGMTTALTQGGAPASFNKIVMVAGANENQLLGMLGSEIKQITMDALIKSNSQLPKGISLVQKLMKSKFLTSDKDECKNPTATNYEKCGYLKVSPDGTYIEGKGDLNSCVEEGQVEEGNLNSLVFGVGESKDKLSGCGMEFLRDGDNENTTLISKGGSGKFVVKRGEETFEYKQMAKGSKIELGKEGQIKSANITIDSGKPVNYVFGNERYENLPEGTQVLYKDGIVTLNNPKNFESDCDNCKEIEIKDLESKNTKVKIQSMDAGVLKFNSKTGEYRYLGKGSLRIDPGLNNVGQMGFKNLDGEVVFTREDNNKLTLKKGKASVTFKNNIRSNHRALLFGTVELKKDCINCEIDFFSNGGTAVEGRNSILVDSTVKENLKFTFNSNKQGMNNVVIPVSERETPRPLINFRGNGEMKIVSSMEGDSDLKVAYIQKEKGANFDYYFEGDRYANYEKGIFEGKETKKFSVNKNNNGLTLSSRKKVKPGTAKVEFTFVNENAEKITFNDEGNVEGTSAPTAEVNLPTQETVAGEEPVVQADPKAELPVAATVARVENEPVVKAAPEGVSINVPKTIPPYNYETHEGHVTIDGVKYSCEDYNERGINSQLNLECDKLYDDAIKKIKADADLSINKDNPVVPVEEPKEETPAPVEVETLTSPEETPVGQVVEEQDPIKLKAEGPSVPADKGGDGSWGEKAITDGGLVSPEDLYGATTPNTQVPEQTSPEPIPGSPQADDVNILEEVESTGVPISPLTENWYNQGEGLYKMSNNKLCAVACGVSKGAANVNVIKYAHDKGLNIPLTNFAASKRVSAGKYCAKVCE